MNYNNLSLDSALSREFSKMGMTVKGLKLLERVNWQINLEITCVTDQLHSV